MSNHRTLWRSVMITVGAITIAGSSASGQAKHRKAPNFTLKADTGRMVSLTDYRDRKALVVVFVGTECPLVNHYVLRLAEIHKEFAEKGVQILAVNSNRQDTFDEMVQHARKRKLPFPVLKDASHKVADLFRATMTPEAFLLDGQRRICYQGRIDDLFGVGTNRSTPTRADLVEAICDVLAGRAVRVPRTKSVGCFIGREAPPKTNKKAATVTYTRHVARILQKNCQECHRPGEVAPFSLLTYDDARSWSKTIDRVVREGQMPPWHADPKHGEFLNDRTLPIRDRKLLLEWIKHGCAKGNPADMPPPRKFPTGWRIGQPEVVLKMEKAFPVPARPGKGGIPYQNFVLKTNFKEDVWIQKAEARPGNRAVVHHMTVYIGKAPNNRAGTSGDRALVAGYVPGNRPTILPDGKGIRIPKGADLILEMHYTANGTEQLDLSSVGLVFAKKKPTHEIRVRFVNNNNFTIPPHADNYPVSQSTTFKKEAMLLSLFPHMHLRGKSFQFHVVYPDGQRQILLSVPRYDFNWQHSYVLKKPLRLPAGTKIECIGRFDNSADNPNNPDPTVAVRRGEQTWDEMMLGAMSYYYVDDEQVPAKP